MPAWWPPPAKTVSAPNRDSAGLTSSEALSRLRSDGANELAPPIRRGIFRIALEVVREPMFLLLLAAGGVYLSLGDRAEALMLMGFVFLVMTMVVTQELRTSRVLETLRGLASPRALVIRDGRRLRIPGREVVKGDLLVLEEGDRVAADAAVLECHDLSVDESLLTGESVPVRKTAGARSSPPAQPGGDDQPWVYAGTLLASGSGLALVTATGPASAIGRIGTSLAQSEEAHSPLQRQMRRLVERLALLVAAICLVLVLLLGLAQGRWLEAVLAGITLAMAALPQEFPVILAVFMALGAWRISQRRVLTRRMDAIETLGATTVLMVDKTGTLTENRMTVASLWRYGESVEPAAQDDLPESFHELVEFAILASEHEPYDPMERAFHDLGRRFLSGTEHLHGQWGMAHEYSLSADLLAMSHVWKPDDEASGGQWVVAAKGAPEAVADLCHLDAAALRKVMAAAGGMADAGLRVLGVARSALASDDWPVRQHDIDFAFIGLVGLADPPRAEVPEAILNARRAGIRVVMVTGDYPRTAQAVARRIGIGHEAVLTGAELEVLDARELCRRIREVEIFARIVPQQKLRLVEAFKANGEVVAMTGDGVNDAPALKAAHIGVAMGGRGSAGAPRRRLRRHRRHHCPGPAHLRQPAEGDELHPFGACADRRHVAVAGAARSAAFAPAGARRVSRTDNRSGLLDRLRGGSRPARPDAPAAARSRRAAVRRPGTLAERGPGIGGIRHHCGDLSLGPGERADGGTGAFAGVPDHGRRQPGIAARQPQQAQPCRRRQQGRRLGAGVRRRWPGCGLR